MLELPTELAELRKVCEQSHELGFQAAGKAWAQLWATIADTMPIPKGWDDPSYPDWRNRCLRSAEQAEWFARRLTADAMAEAARQRKPTRDMVEGIQRNYFSELIPSDYEPSSIGQHLRIEKLAKRLYPKGLVVKGETFDGPHYRAVLDYLGHFSDAPHDREIWAVFHWWSRPSRDDWPLIEEKAKTQGLTAWELIYRETLKELRRYVRSKGIPELSKPAQTQSDAGNGSPIRADAKGPDAGALTERQTTVLAALLELKAVDCRSRRTAQEVARRAGGRNADAELFKSPIAELVRLGFLDSKKGRGGGCWLTDLGKMQAEKR